MNSELEFWKTLAVLLSICLFTTVLFVGLPGIDLWISSLFTNDSGRFFLNWNPYVRFLRSVFIWIITAGIVFSLLMYLTSFYQPGRLKVHRNVWAFVCSSFLLGPGLLVNGILKEYWGRARPQQVLEFGGEANFSSAFSISDQCMQNCSFVSGEGSAAATFAAVLIILIGKNDRVFAWKPLSWLVVAAAGVAAMLRIVLGRHFTSDTIFAILFCTLICVLLYRLFDINRHRREFTVTGVWSDAAGSFPGAYSHAWSSSVKYIRRFAGGVAERARRLTGKAQSEMIDSMRERAWRMRRLTELSLVCGRNTSKHTSRSVGKRDSLGQMFQYNHIAVQAMRCPFCSSEDTQVKDSRPAEDGTAIRRRRVCPDCGGRFTTFERVQLRDLQVIKKTGRRVPFDRDKLIRSFEIALRKRPVERDRVERAVSGIVRRLESSGETDIPSDRIGLMVIEALRAIDDVAFVRYASVYRDFSDPKDFENVINELTAKIDGEVDPDVQKKSMNTSVASSVASDFDRRMMAAAIRYSFRHLGRTGTNPSVATLIVCDTEAGPVIVGRGVTAIGGRPHAETEALAEAGELARGATAYVTLEPCAHHGSTPPCANALVAAGVKRVVAATTDPDHRVSGKGYAILRDAGVEVLTDVLKADADFAMAGYLMQRNKNRAHVTLKMAISADGKIGKRGAGQVAITGEESRAATHILRAVSDIILVGVETALEDDPELTCRLPGLESRSPVRLVLDSRLRLPLSSRLVQSAATTPVIVATTEPPESAQYRALKNAGCQLMACESASGAIALAELLDDVSGRGYFTVTVEGGARVAQSFLAAGLVDRMMLYTGPDAIGPEGVDAPLDADHIPDGFKLADTLSCGRDVCRIYERI